MRETVGFIGLGIMGRGMARNILKAGYTLSVWNRTPSRALPFAELGADVADSPAALASQCDLLMICVSDTPDVAEVLQGDKGILASIRENALIVDHSTISPQATRDFAEEAAVHGAAWLDAPVSGGSEGAENGTLSIMVGGADADVERARPVMETYGRAITHVGGQGSGQLVKLVNQILVVGTYYAVSEALLFAQASGLDLERTLAAVESGAAGSWMLSNRGSQAIKRDWRPGFTINLQQKDLRLALDAAAQLGVPLLNTSQIAQMYALLQRQGLGDEGNHSLIKVLEQMSGIQVGASQ